jgi:hypothetical protein
MLLLATLDFDIQLILVTLDIVLLLFFVLVSFGHVWFWKEGAKPDTSDRFIALSELGLSLSSVSIRCNHHHHPLATLPAETTIHPSIRPLRIIATTTNVIHS